MTDRPERYEALARALLDAPDPVIAIAHELGDHAGRLDALAVQIDKLRASLDYVRSATVEKIG